MRDQNEIVGVAADLKLKMRKRIDRLRILSQNLADVAGKIAPEIGIERLESIENEFKTLEARQELDAQKYATLRWVLDLTGEIDPDYLELML